MMVWGVRSSQEICRRASGSRFSSTWISGGNEGIIWADEDEAERGAKRCVGRDVAVVCLYAAGGCPFYGAALPFYGDICRAYPRYYVSRLWIEMAGSDIHRCFFNCGLVLALLSRGPPFVRSWPRLGSYMSAHNRNDLIYFLALAIVAVAAAVWILM
jgi:hypothetical protein